MSGVDIALRLLSAVLAAALVALGVLVVVEVVAAAFDQPPVVLPYPDVAGALRDSTWQSGLARAVGGALAAVGLLLLVLALRRGRPAGLPLAPLTDGTQAEAHRRGLQRSLQDRAARVDGVRRATAKVGRRSVRVTAHSALRDPAGLPQQVEQQVRGLLDELALRRALAVKVRTRRRT